MTPTPQARCDLLIIGAGPAGMAAALAAAPMHGTPSVCSRLASIPDPEQREQQMNVRAAIRRWKALPNSKRPSVMGEL